MAKRLIMFFVYILLSEKSNRFYVGQTQDLENRFQRHNKMLVRSTKNGVPWRLVHVFDVVSRSEAVVLERKIKARGAKRYLIDKNINLGM
jgi:putative endonuclease